MLLDRREAPEDDGRRRGLHQALRATLFLTVGGMLGAPTFVTQADNIVAHRPLPWVRLTIACGIVIFALWRGFRLLWGAARHSAWFGLLPPVVACVATPFLSFFSYLPVYWLLGGTWFPGK